MAPNLILLLCTFLLAVTGAESRIHGASAKSVSSLPCPPLSVYSGLLWELQQGSGWGENNVGVGECCRYEPFAQSLLAGGLVQTCYHGDGN